MAVLSSPSGNDLPLYPENSVLLAPLAGHTDLPMRLSARRYGCRYAFTEMIDAGSLVFGNAKTLTLIRRSPLEEFLGIQLVGSDPVHLAKAVEIINSRHFDVLDFNLGCPAPKVEKKCEGIAFALHRPDEALKAVELIVKHSEIPVTVKTRIQDFEDPEPTVRFIRQLESTGISAVTLHGRVMKAFYSGPVAFEVIRAVKDSISIPLIANGGITDSETCRELREKTGCSRVMVARGALGNPWIFRQISDPALPLPTVEEFADELEHHISDMIAFYGEELAFRIGRKTVLEYLRGRGYHGALRASASFLKNTSDFEQMMKEIRLGPASFPDSPRGLRLG